MALKAITGDQASLRRLTDVSRALTYARSLDEVLDLTVECAVDLTGASRAVLMLSGEDGLLRIRAARGIDPASVERFREPLDETVITRLAGLLGDEIRDRFLGVPLVVHGDVIGLLGVRREAEHAASEEDEWLLSAIADQAAVALQSALNLEGRESLDGRVGELERRQRTKDRAIEILSHDLRSPLNAIQGYAALLRGEVVGPINDRQREIVERLSRVSRHMESLLDSVLEMARLWSGTVQVSRRPARLSDVVREAVEIVAPGASEARIRLDTSGSEPAPVLETDAPRLRQVLVHLIDNAVKYSPEGSVVRIRWKESDSGDTRWGEVSVQDEGPGIEQQRQKTIFEPYVRGDGSSAGRAQSGVGLGLAIALGVVQNLGGQLLLESEVGRGSTFRVRLPLTARGE